MTFLFFMLAGEHAACGQNVFAAGCSHGRRQSAIIEPLLEIFDDYRCGSFIRKIRNLMETDKVHTTLETLEHTDQCVGMSLCIIEAGEHGVFEAHSSLAGEVVLLDKVDDFLDRPCALHRHDAES